MASLQGAINNAMGNLTNPNAGKGNSLQDAIDKATGGNKTTADKVISAPKPTNQGYQNYASGSTGTSGGGNQGGNSGGGSSGGGGRMYYHSYGSGGGTYSSDPGPSDEQKEAAANLGGIVGYNQDTLKKAWDNAQKMYDTSDEMNRNLLTQQILEARRSAGNDWYAQLQNLQSTTAALADRSGNAMNGSYLYDLWDLISRVDDQQDAETLNTMRENIQNSRDSYFEALSQNINARNELAADTESNLRELFADYAAQVNNIHPDLADDVIDEKGHTLKAPDWITTNWFSDHFTKAAKPEDEGFYRPDRAASSAWSQGLLTDDDNTSSSANKDYRQRLYAGYQHRNMQA